MRTSSATEEWKLSQGCVGCPGLCRNWSIMLLIPKLSGGEDGLDWESFDCKGQKSAQTNSWKGVVVYLHYVVIQTRESKGSNLPENGRR